MRAALSLLALLAIASTAPAAAAQGTLSFSADPATLSVAAAEAGAQPDPDDASSSYTMTGVAATSRVTARLATPLPSGVTLRVTLAAPSGAVSTGAVTLTTTEQDVVTGVPAGNHPSLSVTYALYATTGAGTVALSAVDVLFSLIAQGP